MSKCLALREESLVVNSPAVVDVESGMTYVGFHSKLLSLILL